ncbi:MAG: hypothetical protein GKR89_16235 [Candidatus Latescibacteria bacterium]|nr:hypothetical protein [Candidatus Latescibacterota bacterium]
MSDLHQPEAILAAATALLARHFDTQIHLQPLDTFAASPNKQGSIVLRFQVSGSSALPPTVIVKQVRRDGGLKDGPYRPDHAEGPNIAFGFFNEWAALELLQQIGGKHPLGPALYAGDRDQGLLIMEDLGKGFGGTPADIMESADPEAGGQALLDYARAQGQLHALSAGHADQFCRLREKLGPPPAPLPPCQDPWQDARRQAIPDAEIAALVQGYQNQCLALSVTPQPGYENEIWEAVQQVENPPPAYLALAQGDQNGLGGLLRSGPRLRFYDFDTAGFRHPLREGVPARITWGAMLRVPRPWVGAMDQAYQRELARGIPAMAQDALFHRAIVEAGAHWNIFHVLERLPAGLEKDGPRGASSFRTQVLGWLNGFADMAEEFDHFPALAQTTRLLVERLVNLWPPHVHTPPLWPPFRP